MYMIHMHSSTCSFLIMATNVIKTISNIPENTVVLKKKFSVENIDAEVSFGGAAPIQSIRVIIEVDSDTFSSIAFPTKWFRDCVISIKEALPGWGHDFSNLKTAFEGTPRTYDYSSASVTIQVK